MARYTATLIYTEANALTVEIDALDESEARQVIWDLQWNYRDDPERYAQHFHQDWERTIEKVTFHSLKKVPKYRRVKHA